MSSAKTADVRLIQLREYVRTTHAHLMTEGFRAILAYLPDYSTLNITDHTNSSGTRTCKVRLDNQPHEIPTYMCPLDKSPFKLSNETPGTQQPYQPTSSFRAIEPFNWVTQMSSVSDKDNAVLELTKYYCVLWAVVQQRMDLYVPRPNYANFKIALQQLRDHSKFKQATKNGTLRLDSPRLLCEEDASYDFMHEKFKVIGTGDNRKYSQEISSEGQIVGVKAAAAHTAFLASPRNDLSTVSKKLEDLNMSDPTRTHSSADSNTNDKRVIRLG